MLCPSITNPLLKLLSILTFPLSIIAERGIQDLVRLKANSLDGPRRHDPTSIDGLQPMFACADLNKFIGHIQIDCQMRSVEGLFCAERPTDPERQPAVSPGLTEGRRSEGGLTSVCPRA